MLTQRLGIEQGIRTRPVRITGTRYTPLTGTKEISKELGTLLEAANRTEHPAERALILLGGIAYIQPCEDGNNRTSRVISDAVLLAHNLPPLSYRSTDEVE